MQGERVRRGSPPPSFHPRVFFLRLQIVGQYSLSSELALKHGGKKTVPPLSFADRQPHPSDVFAPQRKRNNAAFRSSASSPADAPAHAPAAGGRWVRPFPPPMLRGGREMTTQNYPAQPGGPGWTFGSVSPFFPIQSITRPPHRRVSDLVCGLWSTVNYSKYKSLVRLISLLVRTILFSIAFVLWPCVFCPNSQLDPPGGVAVGVGRPRGGGRLPPGWRRGRRRRGGGAGGRPASCGPCGSSGVVP